VVEQCFDADGGFGHSEHYAPVRFSGTGAIGSIVAVCATAAASGTLLGEAL
jgi:hypothetical protein